MHAKRTAARTPVPALLLFVASIALPATARAGLVQEPAARPAAGAGELVTAQPFVESIAGTLAAIEMVPIPGGAAADGAPAGGLWMSATEITWDVYDVFVFGLDREPGGGEPDGFARPSKPYITMDRGFGHKGYPALSMSLDGALAFCEWLGAKTGRRYRLPSEAEWERACRAGSRGAWSSGDDEAQLARVAWYRATSERTTHPVARKEPNAWGLYDMHGNAAEWCLVGPADGAAAPRGVVRGGSYRDAAPDVAAAARREPSPAWNASDPQIPKSRWWLADGGFVGFRVVCDGPPPAEEAREGPSREERPEKESQEERR